MAITVDNNVWDFQSSAGSTFTKSFEVIAWSDLCLVATGAVSNGSDVTWITYNWVALTQAVDIENWNMAANVWYLVNPATWFNDLIYTYSSSVAFQLIWAVSLSGVDQSSPLWATNTKTGTAQNKTIDITTTQDNSIVIEAIWAIWWVHTAASGQTEIISNDNRISWYCIQWAAWPKTEDWNSTTSWAYAYVIAEFKEVVSLNNWRFFSFF